jgi:hypothetical protein
MKYLKILKGSSEKISHFRAQIPLILEEQMSMKKADDHGRKVVSH